MQHRADIKKGTFIDHFSTAFSIAGYSCLGKECPVPQYPTLQALAGKYYVEHKLSCNAFFT